MTIGETIDKKADEYITLYKRLMADEEFASRAESLATHDLVMAKYINGKALEKVDKYIALSSKGEGGIAEGE